VLSPTRRLSRSPRATAVAAVALTALALCTAAWLFVRYPGVLVSGVANTDPNGHVDFETFWRSTVAMLHGADTYHTGSVLPNLNPPFLSLLLAPFGLVPLLPSYWAFTALTVLVVTASVLLTARELRLGRGATVFGVATMWACSPLHGTLLLGQIYGLLLFGLVLAWLAQRRGRGRLAAVLLGVVVALKPSLAPLLLIPLAQWRAPGRRAALWAGLGSAAAASVAGVLAAGPSSALDWLRLATHTPAPEVDANASLPGLVVRLGLPGWLGWLVTVAVVVASLWWVRRAVPAPAGLAPGLLERADVTIFAVAPHMHKLGVYLKAIGQSSMEGDRVLLDAPYDFDNQSFSIIKPLKMKKGDNVRVECTHDNTTDKAVTFGESTLSEMCFAGLYRYPADGTNFICTSGPTK